MCRYPAACAIHGQDYARAWSGKLPISDLKSFWGALGCVCWAVCGGLMVLLGFWARLGALALLGFTLIATLLGHGTRGLTGDKRQQQEITIFEHVAIMGGFLFVLIHGAGRVSVDNLLG
jgi:uncharacterized membrane protein YphA (DoxX/SURF4 family)